MLIDAAYACHDLYAATRAAAITLRAPLLPAALMLMMMLIILHYADAYLRAYLLYADADDAARRLRLLLRCFTLC